MTAYQPRYEIRYMIDGWMVFDTLKQKHIGTTRGSRNLCLATIRKLEEADAYIAFVNAPENRHMSTKQAKFAFAKCRSQA